MRVMYSMLIPVFCEQCLSKNLESACLELKYFKNSTSDEIENEIFEICTV